MGRESTSLPFPHTVGSRMLKPLWKLVYEPLFCNWSKFALCSLSGETRFDPLIANFEDILASEQTILRVARAAISDLYVCVCVSVHVSAGAQRCPYLIIAGVRVGAAPPGCWDPNSGPLNTLTPEPQPPQPENSSE